MHNASSDPVERLRAALAHPPAAPSSDFELNPRPPRPDNHPLRPASVLVPLVVGRDGAVEMVLTRRAAGLRTHAGQIALPGGRQEPTDADIIATALREAEEEVGLDPAHVEVLGHLPPHETVTGFIVTPVVGRITAPFSPRPDPHEVAEVFTAPWAHLSDPSRFRVETLVAGGMRRRYFAVPFGPYYIWGATARILRGLAEQVSR
ncbi:MAG: CoA pyrophosphatase [Rhodobacteraceae bacterium]|nr:CoA pyrophosphatase [Paracoccaceae bacterium]